jgi:hypothetical protein
LLFVYWLNKTSLPELQVQHDVRIMVYLGVEGRQEYKGESAL